MRKFSFLPIFWIPLRFSAFSHIFTKTPPKMKKKKTKGVVRKIEKNKNRLKVLQIIPSTIKRIKNKFQRFLRFFFLDAL